jgi:hypothetical protein
MPRNSAHRQVFRHEPQSASRVQNRNAAKQENPQGTTRAKKAKRKEAEQNAGQRKHGHSCQTRNATPIFRLLLFSRRVPIVVDAQVAPTKVGWTQAG